MQTDRFFTTTRGKIVATLRRRRYASAIDLASEFGLSPNAIRQHLASLERESLVSERPVRRGKTKPTLEYSLTPAAESLFPQRYDRLLNAVLREVREVAGPQAVDQIFSRLGKRAASRASARVAGTTGEARVAAMTAVLRESGVDAEFDLTDGRFTIAEHTCPYAATVAEHPEVCSVIHTMLGDVFPEGSQQTESLATGGDACRFEVKA